jgi:putative hydrolase of the HAD superfamily
MLATCSVGSKKFGINPNKLYRIIWPKARELWHKSPARPYCVSIGISSWEALWARFEGDDENLKALRSWAPTYRRQAWHRSLLECGVDDPDFARYLSDEFQRQRRKLHDVYSDVEVYLSRLKETYSLALVTNGAPDLQREKIRGSGIEKYFNEIVISGEVGVGKPHPEIFGIVLKRIGARADEAVMMGNSLETDIRGAQEAGMTTVWMNRNKEKNRSTIMPDYEISSISELEMILDDLA